MSGSFAQNFVAQQVSRTLLQAGFDRSQSSASSVLTELFIRLLTTCATRAAGSAELQGRRISNLEDVARALEEVGVEPDALADFCRTWMAPRPRELSVGGGDGGGAAAGTGAGRGSFWTVGGGGGGGGTVNDRHHHHHHHHHLHLYHHSQKAEELEWEPAAFPINVDELIRHSAHPSQSQDSSYNHLSSDQTSGARAADSNPNPPSPSSSRNTNEPATVRFLSQPPYPKSPHRSTSASIHAGNSHSQPAAPSRKRKRPEYGHLIPFEQSAVAQTIDKNDWPIAKPTGTSESRSSTSTQPTTTSTTTRKPIIPELEPRNSTQSIKSAIAAVKAQKFQHQTGNKKAADQTSRTLSKALLPLLQQRDKLLQATPDSLCRTDKGILDDILGIALPFLPGLLEGQNPVRETVVAARGKRKKALHGPQGGEAVVGSKQQSTPRSGAMSTSVPDQPKIKLKFSLHGNPQQPSDPSQTSSAPSLSASATTLSLGGSPRPSTSQTSHHPPYTHDESVNCICSNPHADYGAFMIACDRCGFWFHGKCVGVPSEHAQRPGQDWFCDACKAVGGANAPSGT
ncbi:hypothetical protein PhCBS80983_g05928 [Powellomyces hirtus]|uniref:PHD-type domain-containing protein n=1 Tax=Powellomyces hirtus TaxID=109895 RepID=A0A507DSN1_9FUNG|nr:hypothetical protein PhCBS80983_g05928 [Powellomyces hirtus]